MLLSLWQTLPQAHAAPPNVSDSARCGNPVDVPTFEARLRDVHEAVALIEPAAITELHALERILQDGCLSAPLGAEQVGGLFLAIAAFDTLSRAETPETELYYRSAAALGAVPLALYGTTVRARLDASASNTLMGEIFVTARPAPALMAVDGAIEYFPDRIQLTATRHLVQWYDGVDWHGTLLDIQPGQPVNLGGLPVAPPLLVHERCRGPAELFDEAERVAGLGLPLDFGLWTTAIEEAFRCTPPSGADREDWVVRLWHLRAAMHLTIGDTAQVDALLAASKELNPALKPSPYGAELLAAWEKVQPSAPGRAVLRVRPAPPRGALWVDGRAVGSPARLGAGVHLIELHGAGETNTYYEVAVFSPGESRLLDWPMESSEGVAAAELPTAAQPATMLGITAGAGWIGSEQSYSWPGLPQPEPLSKWVVPVYLTAQRGERVWLGVEMGVQPLLNGDFLYSTDSEVNSMPLLAHGALAAGLSRGPLAFGVAAGVDWPRRLSARARVEWFLPNQPLSLRLQAGGNLATADEREWATEALITFWFLGKD